MSTNQTPEDCSGHDRARPEEAGALEALRASEIRYRRLFESAKDGILILDAETGMVTDVNPYLLDLLGYSRTEVFRKKVWELGFLADVVANEGRFEKLRQTKYVRYDNLALEGHDGRRHEVEFVSNAYPEGSHEVIQCNIRDISERKRNEAKVHHLTEVLRAIRNVNQLIVREKDPHRLLDEACRLLVENRGYYNAWIVLTSDGLPKEPFFHAGFNGDFAPMTERLRTGNLPICTQAALSSGSIQMKDDPPAQCADCPLSHSYAGRMGFALRLEHAGRVFGWMSLSCPAKFARSAEDQGLMKEVAGDLAFALWAIETEKQHKKQEEHISLLSRMLDDAPASITIHDAAGRFLYANRKTFSLHGYDENEFMAINLHDLDVPESEALLEERFRQIAEKGEASFEVCHFRKDGTIFPLQILAKQLQWQGRPVVLSIASDISERRMAEEALRKSEWYFRSTVDGLSAHIAVLDDQGEIILTNKAYRDFGERSGVDPGTVSEGTNYLAVCDTASGGHSEEANPFADGIREVLSGKRQSFELEYPCHSPDEKRWFIGRVTSINGEGPRRVIVAHENITGRKQAEAEKDKLQAQFAQAQKMESVGRLAGGVAHDYNNMLGVILGYTELALEILAPDDPLRHHLQEILAATRRSAGITRQLLAFSRQQPISPKVLDLNETVESLLKMLRRLIGEDICFSWQPGAHSSTVYMDPAQVDQVLVNLCVNARDAIDDVGKISIETDIRSFDQAYCADNPGCVPGDFVLLAVSDDGCGMNPETLEKIFEPFFTTKQIGKGTGLGLATVYGIVKQNNGFINVYSEPDQGTTFRIYLPRHEGAEEQALKESKAAPDARGNETLLLVEDEPTILRMTTMMLQRLGYRVLAADNPEQAIALAEAYADKIQLMITDVVMPEMNGRELAARLREIHPEIKVLFMSGYTADVIAHRSVLEKGVNFIQKPFSKKDLADKVRGALG